MEDASKVQFIFHFNEKGNPQIDVAAPSIHQVLDPEEIIYKNTIASIERVRFVLSKQKNPTEEFTKKAGAIEYAVQQILFLAQQEYIAREGKTKGNEEFKEHFEQVLQQTHESILILEMENFEEEWNNAKEKWKGGLSQIALKMVEDGYYKLLKEESHTGIELRTAQSEIEPAQKKVFDELVKKAREQGKNIEKK